MSQPEKNQLRTGDTLPPLTRTFDLVRDSLNEEKRTVDITFSTENPVERWFGIEILDHSAKAVRLGRMNDSAPFLMDHDPKDQRGVIEFAEVRNKEGRATVRFSKNQRGQELLDDIKDGIRKKISVGYRIHEFERTARENAPDEYRATSWEPFEASSVSIPADIDAKTRSEDAQFQPFGARAEELASRITVSPAGQRTNQATKEMANKPTENEKPEEKREAEKPEATPKPEASRSGAEQVPAAAESKPEEKRELVNTPDPEAQARAMQKAIADDRERCEEIRSIGAQFGIDDAAVSKAIRENASVESFKIQILDAQRANPSNAPIPTPRPPEPESNGERGSKEFMIREWHNQACAMLRKEGYNAPDLQVRTVEIERRERPDTNNIMAVRSLTGIATLADVAVLDAGIGAPIIDETTYANPEIGIFPVDTISGAEIKLSVRTGLPTVGARNVNEGTDWKAGTYESKLFELAIIEERAAADIALLKTSKNPARVLTSRATDVTEAVMNHVCVQTWYGASAQSGADAKWTPGIYQQYSADSDHEINATGSTAKTSVWILALGIEKLDHIYGADSFLNFRDMWEEETVEDANGKKFRAMTNYLNGLVGVRLSNKNAAIRIKNLGTDTGKGLTDSLLSQAFELVENLGMQPTAIMMNPRSKRQLQQSRTTYSPVGLPAPVPTEYEGVPIVTTKNLSNAETI